MSEEITADDLASLRELRDKIAEIEKKAGIVQSVTRDRWPKTLDTWYSKQRNAYCHDPNQWANQRPPIVDMEYIGKKEVHKMDDAHGNPVTRFEGELIKNGRFKITKEDIDNKNAEGTPNKK
jgi:hypothetical protein